MLEIRDLAVARGAACVLEGLAFTLAPGQALILRGPNGSGKTTLLRTLAGLQPPQAGEILGGGEEIAYAGHSDGLKSMLTVAENLTFWAEIYGTRGIDPALAAFELTPLRDRLAGTLSAGQKRRLGLARMLVTGRPIWAMDEPTVSLDAASVELFAATVRAHLGQGGLAVIATHIDLGLPEAHVFDVSRFAARAQSAAATSDEAFL
ncbi:heme ABC exporter ATP-binding protein CcmA [Aliishimia ponticola]